MAKYDDYLEREIDEAAANQRARDEKGRYIPDRFKGKDISDVIQSYEELEKLNSRQAQDLGTMRKQVDQLLEQVTSSPAPEPSKPVSVDDLYEDADGNIRRVVREEALGKVEALEQELQNMRLERKLGQIDSQYPGWREKVVDEDFKSWVQESPYRTRMVQDADAGDLDAAEEILGLYYDNIAQDTTTNNRVREELERERAINEAMLESGSPRSADIEESYSRHELMEKRLAAKRGDYSAERWLAAHAKSIARAYAEDRIVD